MSVGIIILSHRTSKRQMKHVLKNEEALDKIKFYSLVSRQVIEIKLNLYYTEWDSMLVHFIYDIESRSFS